MKVTWQVDDGYVGGSRPQYSNIPDDDILECESEEEILDLISEWIEEDYSQNITWHFDNKDRMLEEIRELKSK